MKKTAFALAAITLISVVAAYRAFHQPSSSQTAHPAENEPVAAHPSLLYGRITTADNVTYQGRLRFGGRQEAFWGDYFNGAKNDNPWAAYVPSAQLPKRRDPFRIFGLEIFERESPIDLNRLFMARLGDITRIEAIGRDVRVTLKSGAVFDLGRFEASDFDDGVRVWDPTRGIADLDSLRIRSIELLPSPTPGPNPDRLHGAVRTRHATYTGFIQWDRELSLGSDTLAGRTAQGEQKLLFSAIRSIARHSPGSSLVTLLDGRQIQLSGTTAAGENNRGVYVDDPRYGRVLVSWDAFETIDFTPAPAGPSYSDFPPGHPLLGLVTTRDGRRLEGRIVFDLDESETTETLDAPFQGVHYTLPFGLVASIKLPPAAPRARITLHNGEQLHLNLSGDLAPANAGILVFTGDSQRPAYLRWSAVAHIQLDRPPAIYPPLPRR
jgi:hypothetical protein